MRACLVNCRSIAGLQWTPRLEEGKSRSLVSLQNCLILSNFKHTTYTFLHQTMESNAVFCST